MPSVNKRTAKINTSVVAIVSMLHGYSRQRRNIDSFLATAGLYAYLFMMQYHAFSGINGGFGLLLQC